MPAPYGLESLPSAGLVARMISEDLSRGIGSLAAEREGSARLRAAAARRTPLGYSPAEIAASNRSWAATLANPRRAGRLAKSARAHPEIAAIRAGASLLQGGSMGTDWGQVLSAGATAIGNVFQAKYAAQAARYMPPPMYGGSNPYGYGAVPQWMPAQQPSYYGQPQQPQPPQYYAPSAPTPSYYPPGGGAAIPVSYTPVSYRPGAEELGVESFLPALATGVRALAATPAVRSLVTFLGRYVAPAAAVEIIGTLAHSGHLSLKGGPYKSASDNRLTGVYRGDVKAVKRLRKAAPKLMAALRSAGVGRHRAAPRRMQTRVVYRQSPRRRRA